MSISGSSALYLHINIQYVILFIFLLYFIHVGPAINSIVTDSEEPLPSLSDWHDYEPNLEFDDSELLHPTPDTGEYSIHTKYYSFLKIQRNNLKIFWLGALGLGGFVLDDEEFISGDFNDDRDDIKELEADNYEDQLAQPEVISL